MDDEILLGCKSPEDESNLDLRPVTQLGLQDGMQYRSNMHQKEPPMIANGKMAKRGKTSEGTARTRLVCNRIQALKAKERPPIVVLSQEAK